jgi:hypothetical protein
LKLEHGSAWLKIEAVFWPATRHFNSSNTGFQGQSEQAPQRQKETDPAEKAAICVL